MLSGLSLHTPGTVFNSWVMLVFWRFLYLWEGVPWYKTEFSTFSTFSFLQISTCLEHLSCTQPAGIITFLNQWFSAFLHLQVKISTWTRGLKAIAQDLLWLSPLHYIKDVICLLYLLTLVWSWGFHVLKMIAYPWLFNQNDICFSSCELPILRVTPVDILVTLRSLECCASQYSWSHLKFFHFSNKAFLLL